jgi:hypothetical protein
MEWRPCRLWSKDERILGEGEWLRGLGQGKGAELARSANGLLVAAWRTSDHVTLDCEALEPIGDSDLVVASFEPTGEVADGAQIASRLDGRSLRIDPGPRKLRIESGGDSVEIDVLILIVLATEPDRNDVRVDVGFGNASIEVAF